VRRSKSTDFLPPKKNFIQAKYDFIDEMLRFGQFPGSPVELQAQRAAAIDSTATAAHGSSTSPTAEASALAESAPEKVRILDVGCGIGGTTRHATTLSPTTVAQLTTYVFTIASCPVMTRYLAKKLGDGVQVTGITLSGNQARRATALAQQQGAANVEFKVMDALSMTFPDNSFDYVWACESGEHMPDKARYVQEMTRVLKPGGRIVVATWCQRDDSVVPFTKEVTNTVSSCYGLLHLTLSRLGRCHRNVACWIFCTPSGRTRTSSP
jgi:MPBQ/MSBQ methyltransferase